MYYIYYLISNNIIDFGHFFHGFKYLFYFVVDVEPAQNPCIPSPCGVNTQCEVLDNRAVCSCLPDFLGDPHAGCRPECTINSDCPRHQACINRHCKDPCSLGNICGLGAICSCRDHTATCTCLEGFSGDPFIQCIPHRKCISMRYSVYTFDKYNVEYCLNFNFFMI